jgi:hypothetical protein
MQQQVVPPAGHSAPTERSARTLHGTLLQQAVLIIDAYALVRCDRTNYSHGIQASIAARYTK